MRASEEDVGLESWRRGWARAGGGKAPGLRDGRVQGSPGARVRGARQDAEVQRAPRPALTDWALSLLLSRDLLLASRFFFLCRGLDSRIISSSSKVGSQCRRPFCGGRALSSPHPGVPPAPPRCPRAYVGHEAGLHLLLAQVVPQHAGQRRGRPHVLQAGDAVLGAHGEQLERGPRQRPPRRAALGTQGLRALALKGGGGFRPVTGSVQ